VKYSPKRRNVYMGLFDLINGEIERAFKNYAKSKKCKDRQRYLQFKELEHTPFLLDSAYLLELSDGANALERDSILDYMYRFHNMPIGNDEHLDILAIDSYKAVEKSIIDRKWK
jgi:hypothetical protein